MKKSKFTNEQIAFAIKQVATGTPIQEVCGKLGISQQTLCRWTKKFDEGVTSRKGALAYKATMVSDSAGDTFETRFIANWHEPIDFTDSDKRTLKLQLAASESDTTAAGAGTAGIRG